MYNSWHQPKGNADARYSLTNDSNRFDPGGPGGQPDRLRRPLAPGRTPGAATAPLDEPAAAPQPGNEGRPAGWSEASHSNDVDPNYAVVFPIDAVNNLTITVAPED